MHKRILGLILGAGFLCAQVANASEMVRYEPNLYLAKSETTDMVKKTTSSVDKTKKMAEKGTTKHSKAATKNATNKKHHHAHKHHHAKKHAHKQHHKKKHHAKHKREMTKSGMERYIDKVAPEHN
jgi:hypothetical protein